MSGLLIRIPRTISVQVHIVLVNLVDRPPKSCFNDDLTSVLHFSGYLIGP